MDPALIAQRRRLHPDVTALHLICVCGHSKSRCPDLDKASAGIRGRRALGRGKCGRRFLLDVEAEHGHAVDALREQHRVVEREASSTRREMRRAVSKRRQVRWFLRVTLRILYCCSVSWEMLSGGSSESTMPWTRLILAVVHDEDTVDVELDLVDLLLGFEDVEERARINASK